MTAALTLELRRDLDLLLKRQEEDNDDTRDRREKTEKEKVLVAQPCLQKSGQIAGH
jgi:hypothetical protein